MIKQRLANLRNLLAEQNFAGYIVPTTDEYLSEYTPDYAKRLEYITGFSGSNGLAIILKDIVLFFTDGRYITQASGQLDDHLFKIYDQQLLIRFPWPDYITQDEIIAFDPKLFTKNTLKNFSAINTQSYSENLIDKIWQEQPARPNSEIYDYKVEYAGEDYQAKIRKCRAFLADNQAESLVITDSASVCWLFNIRSHDVEFSPLLLAHAIITTEQVYLFTDKSRLEKSWKRPEITILPESEFASTLEKLSGTVLFDENQCSVYIADLIKPESSFLPSPSSLPNSVIPVSTIVIPAKAGIQSFSRVALDSRLRGNDNEEEGAGIAGRGRPITNPCMLWKACKNDIEIKHMQLGHVQDAVAVCELLSYIANNDVSSLSEYDIGQKLTALRTKGMGYVFDSFPAICGYQENGAIIHYWAMESSAKKLSGTGLLLIDSGGQYLGATTDITRTISIGVPTDEQKQYYTKVLKGHIALGNAVFPQNKITGAHLDILARQYLWNEGADYAHGTGHGVGSFLSVHEGPQNISLTSTCVKIAKGMVISNEPGYYIPEKYGIRIENLMYAMEASSGFLKFEMLTLVPYAKELIDFNQLTKPEIDYLKSYYLKIENQISPLLSKTAKKWLQGQIELINSVKKN